MMISQRIKTIISNSQVEEVEEIEEMKKRITMKTNLLPMKTESDHKRGNMEEEREKSIKEKDKEMMMSSKMMKEKMIV
jgi:hypothetical protein